MSIRYIPSSIAISGAIAFVRMFLFYGIIAEKPWWITVADMSIYALSEWIGSFFWVAIILNGQTVYTKKYRVVAVIILIVSIISILANWMEWSKAKPGVAIAALMLIMGYTRATFDKNNKTLLDYLKWLFLVLPLANFTSGLLDMTEWRDELISILTIIEGLTIVFFLYQNLSTAHQSGEIPQVGRSQISI